MLCLVLALLLLLLLAAGQARAVPVLFDNTKPRLDVNGNIMDVRRRRKRRRNNR